MEEFVEAGREWWTLLRHGASSWEGDTDASIKLKRGASFGFLGNKISLELARCVAFPERVVGDGVSDYSALSSEL